MSNSTIDGLPAGTALTGTEEIPVWQSVSTKKITAAAIAALNNTAINANAAAISSLTTTVTIQGGNIASNTASIVGNTASINILNTEVAANTANITTNTTNIAANTAALAALQTLPNNLTLANLRQAVTTVTGTAVTNTIDTGTVEFAKGPGGSTWYPTNPFVVGQSAIPFVLPPSGWVNNNGDLVLGQAPAGAATVSFSAASGSGVTMTFSAATLAGTASDNGRILTILDSGPNYVYATITAFSSTTVATVTISTGGLSGTGPFANNAIWLSNNSTGSVSGYATPLPRVYSSCYMYFQPGALFTSSFPGWYYTVMDSSTHGTVFNNIYRGAQPVVPSAASFATTGPGAYTQLTTGTNALTAQTATVPGNVMNFSGMLEMRYTLQATNNGNTKQVNCIFGGLNMAGDSVTTATWREYWRMIQNAGATNLQTVFSSSSGGAPGTGTNIQNQAVNTLIGQNASLNIYMATVPTDYVVVESYSFTVTPSAVLDSLTPPSIFIPTPSIIPTGAAAMGITTNTWLAFPQVSDVSFNLTDTTHKLYAGQWYNANPPYSPTGGYLQNATINGVNYLQINQLGDGHNAGVTNQNQSSVQGTLRLASASAGFYVEVASTLLTPNGFNTDNFPASFMNPTEHNAANGSGFPYLELDIEEGWVFSLNSNNPYWGPCTSLVDWPSGSGGAGVTQNNSNAVNAGPNLNRNQENVMGFSLDPVLQQCTWWINGVMQWQKTIAPQIAGGRVLGRHYYLTFGASSRSGAVNAGNAYSHLIRYCALWGG
jgi:hypothetical protein